MYVPATATPLLVPRPPSTQGAVMFVYPLADTFRCYDFDESNELTVDEMTLSLKSTLAGLAKLTGLEPPDDLELEDIAQLASATGGGWARCGVGWGAGWGGLGGGHPLRLCVCACACRPPCLAPL
jgi:hypothetical protein